MVNEELSAKSIHFVVDYMVKPAARDLAKTLEKEVLIGSLQIYQEITLIRISCIPLARL